MEKQWRLSVRLSSTFNTMSSAKEESSVDVQATTSSEVSTETPGPTDFPDGGYGWICVLCSFIFHFFAIGIESTWGVYQRYFFDGEVFPGASNSELAWVGSIQAAGVPIVGLFAGMLAEKIGYRYTSALGSTIMSAGLIIASFSTKPWHLYLTQGLIFGIGSGIAFIPAVTIASQWFDKRRGLATGICVSGSGIGGLVLSPLTSVFIERLGFRWALRITGFISFGALSIAAIFLKTRTIVHSSREPSTKVSIALFKDRNFILLGSIGFCSTFGFYIPIFFVPDFATNHLSLSASSGSAAVALIAGLSAIGRILMGIFGDRFGHINALIWCQCMGAVSQMAVWPSVKSSAGLMAFCSYFGFFSGGFVSLYPVVAAQIYGTNRLASIAGALFLGLVPGTLAGPPIGGALIDKNTGPTGRIGFLSCQLYGGGCMTASAVMAILTMLLHRKMTVEKDHPSDVGVDIISSGDMKPESEMEQKVELEVLPGAY